ncbi:hypothetical protein SLE2022_178030 [Rubroshorea leprosula]
MELKFNIDVVVSLEHSQVVMVVVCRDRNGVLNDGCSFKQAVDSVLVAEALAFRAVVGMTLSLGVHMAIFELDNQALIQMMKKEIVAQWQIEPLI